MLLPVRLVAAGELGVELGVQAFASRGHVGKEVAQLLLAAEQFVQARPDGFLLARASAIAFGLVGGGSGLRQCLRLQSAQPLLKSHGADRIG